MVGHAGNRPGIDEGPASAVTDQRCDGLDAQEWPGQVNRDHPVPVLKRGVGNATAAQCDTCVIDQNMKFAEFFRDTVHNGFPISFVSDIEVTIMGNATGIPDGLRHRFTQIILNICQNDPGSGF